MFQTELVNVISAIVQSFDGSANVLSLTLPTERGGENLTVMILQKLHALNKNNPDISPNLDNAGSSNPCALNGPQTKSVPEPKHKPAPVDTTASVKPPELTAHKPQQKIASVEPACGRSS